MSDVKNNFRTCVKHPRSLTMPVETILRTARIAVLIGLSLAFKHLLEVEEKNVCALVLVFCAFLVVFGLDFGFRRWTMLMAVASCAYLASFYALDLPELYAAMMKRTPPRRATASSVVPEFVAQAVPAVSVPVAVAPECPHAAHVVEKEATPDSFFSVIFPSSWWNSQQR